MAHYDFDIGILGGGAGGLTVAAGAAQLGAKTILIEKDEKLGGDCLHFGCVPSKTLIRTAKVYHLMKEAKRFGLPEVDLRPVDYKKVARRIQSVISAIQEHDSPERFCKLGAKVEFGEASFIDEHSVLLHNKSLSAKTWVIATGSSPFVPPIEGLDKTAYLTNRDVYSLERLPTSMIVLGAGPIGIEMAQAFSRLGTKVSVIDLADQILNKEDKDMADQVMNIMADEGVTFYLNSSATGVKEVGAEKEVLLKTSQGEMLPLRAEVILVAVGRSANTEGLGLENIGIKYDKKGIAVDEKRRTNHNHIYAIGDVNGGYLFTHVAGYEGSVVIRNVVFHLPQKVDYTFLPWCTYTDPELANIGMNEKAAKAANLKYSVWTEEFKANDRSLAEGEPVGKIKMILDEKEKPIGIQIFGPQAGELINEWVAALNGGMKLSTLASSVHPYPTLGEINKHVAGKFLSTKVFSEKVLKGLHFLFRLKGRACEPH